MKMTAGRHKSENAKRKYLQIRLTDEELAEIEKLAAKLKMSKSATILKAVKEYRPIITRSQLPNFKPKKIPKVSEGVIDEGEIVWFNKKK